MLLFLMPWARSTMTHFSQQAHKSKGKWDFPFVIKTCEIQRCVIVIRNVHTKIKQKAEQFTNAVLKMNQQQQ